VDLFKGMEDKLSTCMDEVLAVLANHYPGLFSTNSHTMANLQVLGALMQLIQANQHMINPAPEQLNG
jgi:hypothetical protein